jgi:hypothetical protein
VSLTGFVAVVVSGPGFTVEVALRLLVAELTAQAIPILRGSGIYSPAIWFFGWPLRTSSLNPHRSGLY